MSTTFPIVPDCPTFARELPRRLHTWLQAVRTERADLRGESVVELDKGAAVWIDHPLAREVHCVEGALWLTFDGEPGDHVLEKGQSLHCPHRSRLGISALARAIVRVT